MTMPVDDNTTAESSLLDPSRREALQLGGIVALGAVFSGLLTSVARAATDAAGAPFEILFAIYPNGTLLDFAGPNEIFTRIPNTKVRFASPAGGSVTLENGLVFGPTERLEDVARVDLLCVPGGPDLRAMTSPEVLGHIRRLADDAKYVTSVCTGALILAASGVLKGKRSACHWACLNLLKDYGAIPDPARVVKDGRFISGGGVTSGIDFALVVAEELSGQTAAQVAQLLIEYNPAPPFAAGHPSQAPKDVLDLVEMKIPGASNGVWPIAM